MGLLVVGVVAGLLVGFAWLAPSQGHLQTCMFQWQGCFDEAAISPPAQLQQVAVKPDPQKAQAKSHNSAKPSIHASAKPHRPIAHAKNAVSAARITVSAPDHRPDETSDPVLNKARATIAAKMENPASAEFSDMDRAFRKNTFGRATDTICGHVKGKTASGEDTGERPFLYLVKEDDAYVVDGKPDTAAAIAYRNICN